MRCEEEEILWQLVERCKEEEEMSWQLVEQGNKAEEEYLSHFTVDHHQKIIRRGEIDMESILPPPQTPIVSIPNPSLKVFMKQWGDQ